ncbi:MAG: phenylalanine--tRNA ligase subunit beta [Cyanothece sp. SIO2G6]|nr:phenylalanine--tRNA ligase subunit beta [Cyanothece sp. SIO2G6]
MRISLEWLQELVDFSMSPEELADMLTMAGFEVEDIEDRRTWAEGVVIGRVSDHQPHPDADKLSVCTVDIGAAEPSTIVCGASNVRADIYVAVATVGTFLPIVDLKIKPRKLRGVPSAGMICSLSELGLAKESAGIHIFSEEDLHPGDDARPYLGLTDVILDVTSTANRADALSMIGIAREVAALTGNPLKFPAIPADFGTPATDALTVQVSQTTACPIYIGTAIEQVAIAPSPPWLQQRLEAAGTRPINNIVDITNYVLLEWGQPLHAFDRDRLQSVTQSQALSIGVRFAQAGEVLTTLDSQERQLIDQSLVITANDHPVALAGVMGGEETEVHDGTQNVMLEAALFDPVAIRRSARGQSLRTEASTRYERGVNQAELELACRRALQLITELAGGTLTAQSVDDHRDAQIYSRVIDLRFERVNAVLGTLKSANTGEGDTAGYLAPADIEQVLTALGCTLERQATEPLVWTVTAPPYRYRDLEREIDLIEEVARIYGYDKFADTLPGKSEPGRLSAAYAATQRITAALRAEGLTELIHYSLGKPDGEAQINLSNPLLEEYSALRTELLSGLIEAFRSNWEKGNGALNGYEVGHIFWQEDDGSFAEADLIAGILGGASDQGRWVNGGRTTPMIWFEAKGILEAVLQRLDLTVTYKATSDRTQLHPGRTAELWSEGKAIGVFGQLHPQVRQDLDLPDEVYVFELQLAALLTPMGRPNQQTPLFKAYSTFPASDRDIAFYAPVDVPVADLEKVVMKAGKSLLESVELFDEFQGESVSEGQRSLAFRLVYRAGDRTLTDEDVDPVHNKVRDALVKSFKVELRS